MHLRSASMVEEREEDPQAGEYLGVDMPEEDSISRRAERGSPVAFSQPQTTIPPSMPEDAEGEDVVPTSQEEVERSGFAPRYAEGTDFTLFPSPEDTPSEPEIRSSYRLIAPAPPGYQRPDAARPSLPPLPLTLQNWVADRPSGPWSPGTQTPENRKHALHSDHDQYPENDFRGYPNDRDYPDKMEEEIGKIEEGKDGSDEEKRRRKKRARREKRKGDRGMQSDRKLRGRKDDDEDRNGGGGGGQSMSVR